MLDQAYAQFEQSMAGQGAARSRARRRPADRRRPPARPQQVLAMLKEKENFDFVRREGSAEFRCLRKPAAPRTIARSFPASPRVFVS
ncbi:MAG: hypothetical protein IPH26_09170 [Sterolibacteriaceae bacterium]|uniref:Uncharacterized protein n=1 Tax=Candidatus Methylophosphatis roskildensis TaxID=2899263 RepID=A0A9D7DYD9_9PROT|nr:hypothetical protein [Candidatus Methylophosphatis roskildensis]